jgi:hypothetical protein
VFRPYTSATGRSATGRWFESAPIHHCSASRPSCGRFTRTAVSNAGNRICSPDIPGRDGRFEFLLGLVPGAKSVAYLRNPTNPIFAESETREVEAAARSFGVKLAFFNASDSGAIEKAFREIVQERMDALFVSADGFLLTLALASLNLACRNPVPTFPQRSPPLLLTTAACGGLRSTPDCRPRKTFLHLSYSCATSFGPAILVTQDPNRTLGLRL